MIFPRRRPQYSPQVLWQPAIELDRNRQKPGRRLPAIEALSDKLAGGRQYPDLAVVPWAGEGFWTGRTIDDLAQHSNRPRFFTEKLGIMNLGVTQKQLS